MRIFEFFLKYIGKMVGAVAGAGAIAGAEIFNKLEPKPEQHKKDCLRNTG
jgi:hypothetical protein